MFQGVRQNGLFYILEKGDDLRLRVGQVISVSNPQPKYGQFNTPTFGSQPEMTVDIRVKVDDETLDFKQLSANASIANSGNVVVSDSKDAMSAEVEGLLRTSKAILESIPYHEKMLSSCDNVLRDLNPSFRKEKEQEEKMTMLEGEVIGIKDTLNEMMGLLSNALGQSKSKKKEE
jgi:ribosome-associated translation inhibitor RaiA